MTDYYYYYYYRIIIINHAVHIFYQIVCTYP